MIREFNCYREILSIYPGLVCTGWAVFGDKSGSLLACGVAQPFTRINETQSIMEMRTKLLKVWEDRVGFSRSPRILAVEQLRSSEEIGLNELVSVAVMSGLLWASLNPEQAFFPKPATWKRNIPLDGVNERILSRLNQNSKKILAEGLHVVPRHLRHNVYNAVGIGQWAYRQTQKVDA